MTISLRLLAIAPLALFGAYASAQVAYDDFGSTNGHIDSDYDTSTGWTVQGANAAGLVESAEQFTSSATGVVTSVSIALTYAGGSGTSQVELVTDSGGAIGTTLETWTLPPSGSFGSWSAPSVLLGDGSASVTAGTTYWLVAMESNEANSDLSTPWNWSNTGANLGLAQNQGSGWTYFGSQTAAAFEVNLTPSGTPEPFTMALGLAGVGIAIRRRAKKA